MNKRIVSVLAVLFALLLLLPSCGDKTVTYKADVAAQEIVDSCAAPLASFSLLAEADEDYIKYRMLLDTTTVDSHAVYIQNAGTSIDEIGVFQCTSDDTSSIVAMVEDYLKRRNDEWTGQYLVEEYPKLRDAEYRIFGRYVVYGILSEEDKTQFFDAVESYLKEK